MIGLGSIGMGTLPLVLKHIDIDPSRVTIVTAEDRAEQAAEVSERYGVNTVIASLTPDTFENILAPHLGNGDFCLNLSVDVSSCDMMSFCNNVGSLYLDTVVEPWAGGYTDLSMSPSERSNYAMREQALAVSLSY